MRVLQKKPGEPPEIVDIPNALKALQEALGGNIQAVPLCPELVVICNEEGRLMGLPPNIAIPTIGLDFVGTILFCGVKGDEFTDIPELWEKILLFECRERS